MTRANIVIPEVAGASITKNTVTSKVKKIKEDPTATSLKTDKTTTKKEKVLADANDDEDRTKES